MTQNAALHRSVRLLHEGWQLARTEPGACTDPARLDALRLDWRPARVPGTVASSLQADLRSSAPYDRDDWWYRVRFAVPARDPRARCALRFAGLATLAEVWLNGEPLASSRNMYLPCEAEVTRRLREENELAIRFASLEAACAARRPRGRWKSALVARQDLRWFRTTLLGRMPGWTPAIDPVGPWGPVSLECEEAVHVERARVLADVVEGVPRLRVELEAQPLRGTIEEARVRVGDRAFALALERGERFRVHGDLAIPGAPLWWPHTHGRPRLAAYAIELRVDREWRTVEHGRIGFRRVELDAPEDRVGFQVNDTRVFCRGACWTPLDFLALRSSRDELRAGLEQLRDAGANMLRIGGTMVYESDEFYELCDELGILVWQDFMFASLDYPARDAAFVAEVDAEARALLGRLHRHACVAAYCGGSEVAQQAAMLGLPASLWSNELFTARLPAICAELHPGVAYFPSTPWGGALPFHPGSGIAHYYGVGAYRRPLVDARLAQVRFATECLAFSNVPEEATMAALPGGPLPAPHDPEWKARQPRDNGAGWDFEDVRDHYLRELFGEDPVALRSRDLARYYTLSRVVPGELMRRVFGEWRSAPSTCAGGLVWLHRDLIAGAGWGIVDATGRPKAAYWYLKRAWAPRSIHVTDEGLNGLAIHVVNEAAEPLAATVELDLWRQDGVATERASHGVLVPARGSLTLGAEAMLGFFADASAAYRFGPPRHEAIAARLVDPEGRVLAEDFHFPQGLGLAPRRDAQVRAQARFTESGEVEVALASDAFLQSVCIACDGFLAEDNHFHLAPGREKRVRFRAMSGHAAAFSAQLQALNLAAPVMLRASRDAGDRAA